MANSRPLPSHIAWRVAPHPQALLRAVLDILARPGLTDRHLRNRAVQAHLDAEARAQGCMRVAGPPKCWMTPEEYEEYRREDPGYRRDPAAHREAALAVPRRLRLARARAGGAAGKGSRKPRGK